MESKTNKAGDIVEAMFQQEVMTKGGKISKPFSHNYRYDFVTDFNGTLKRVQVKSSNADHSKWKKNRYGAHKVNSIYSKKDVDVLAVFALGTWYLIPVEEITGKGVWVYPYSNDSKGKYEQYKRTWNILK